MYLFEAKGSAAFELVADLFEPISEIAQDKEILVCVQTKQRAKAIIFAIKNHAQSLNKILALCNGVPEEDYNKSVPEMMADIMKIVNHPIIAELFSSQAQNDTTSFGSATENTEANGQ